MNTYLIAILFILTGNYLLRFLVELLNLSSFNPALSEEFQGYYQPESYRKSQEYLKENTKFKLVQETVFTLMIIIFILAGGFNFLDQSVRSLKLNPGLTGLIFAGIMLFVLQILEILFAWYRTFVIEEKYGFNKTTLKTFILDRVKSWLLLAVIGGLPFYAVVMLFTNLGDGAWLWCWLGIIIFETFIVFIQPLVIFPLFNKFTPLEEGELKKAVCDYARAQNFALKGIFKIDGSRRSSKANAFFTGIGRLRRIALFDTLIQKHNTPEIVSVLAHEIGHYKKRHLLKGLLLSLSAKGLMFYLLSLFINNPGLFVAFRMEKLSVYASIIFFSFLYTPVNFIMSIAGNILSRKYEYQADSFSVSTYRNPQAFISGLKGLSVNNLSNLTPHPLKVFLDYSHPPVLKRITALRQLILTQMPKNG